jgi:hypothetical protein
MMSVNEEKCARRTFMKTVMRRGRNVENVCCAVIGKLALLKHSQR